MKGEKQNMNKLFTKIAKLTLGLAMAAGVGVAVSAGKKDTSPVHAANSTYNKVSLDDIAAGDQVLIVAYYNSSTWYYLPSTTTSSAPTATSVTISNNTITADLDSMMFTVGGTGSSRTFSNGTNYLANGSANNSVRINTTTSSSWTITATTNGYKMTNNSRWLGVYNGADWRSYTTSNASNYKNSGEYINFYKKAASKTLSSISVSGYTTEFTQGGAFSFGGTVTATYTDKTTADVTSSATFSGYNMSTTGNQTVTASYTEGGVTKTATYGITVNAPVAATGITLNKNSTSIVQGSSETLTATVTPNNAADKTVLWSVSPQNQGVTVSNGTVSVSSTATVQNYTITATANGGTNVTATCTVSVTKATSLTDTINYAFTAISGTGYKAWSGKEGTSGAVYAGQSNAGVQYVQIRSTNPSGIVCTTSGGTAKSVKVTWGGSNTNGRVVTFYGKNTAYSEPADLYDSNKMGTSAGSVTFSTGASSATANLTGDYSFLGIKSNGAAYMTSIEITWSQEQEEKEIESIFVSDNSGKSWYAGDTLNASDLSVEVTYDSGDPATITNGTGVYFDSNHTQTTYTLSQGTNSITVYYTDEFGSADNSEEPLSITAGAARNLSSIAISTPPTKTIYEAGETFNASGMVVTASFTAGPTADVSSEVTISPDGALTVGTTSVTVSYIYKGTTKTATQAITVNAAPVVIDVVGVTASGKWHPTASGSTFTDSAGNTATLTTDTGHFGTSNPLQIGKNADAGTYVEVIIPLSAKAGIDAASATFKSNGASTTVTVFIYGDTDNDLIATGSVTGNSDLIKIETGNSYEKINAERIKYRFELGGTGMFLSQLTYTLGSTVADFGTMVDLDILTPASNTQFKEGDTFSGAGIVLLATDDSEPAITKNLSSGLKFGTSQGDDSFTGHPFDATDAATGSFTVYVTATVGSVTMSVTYTITVTEVPTYSLVTDYSSLYEGAKVIVVAGTNAIGSFEPTYANSVEPVFTGDDVTDGNGATEFTVRIYGDKFGLQFGTYFLALNGDNNQLHRNLSLDDAGAWTKDETGIASPVEGRYIRYNSSKFTCDKSGTESELYISDKAPKTSTLGAETFAYKYLHMRDYTEGDGSCMNDSANHYYSTAKAFYTSASFSSDEKVEFAKITDAVARLQAWARANGETFDPSTKTFSANKNVYPLFVSEKTNTVAIIVIISMVSVTAIGGYFFLRKRKENN